MLPDRLGGTAPFTGSFHLAVTRRGQVTDPRADRWVTTRIEDHGNRDARVVLRV